MTGLIGTTLQPDPLTGQLSDEHRGEDPRERGLNTLNGRIQAGRAVTSEGNNHPGLVGQLVQFSYRPAVDSSAVVAKRCLSQRLT